jgi:hypothetical protein
MRIDLQFLDYTLGKFHHARNSNGSNIATSRWSHHKWWVDMNSQGISPQENQLFARFVTVCEWILGFQLCFDHDRKDIGYRHMYIIYLFCHPTKISNYFASSDPHHDISKELVGTTFVWSFCHGTFAQLTIPIICFTWQVIVHVRLSNRI